MNFFYRLMRILVRRVLQIYFKKISLQGAKNIDPSKPLLIAVNHPNSFLEACVLACWLPIPLHFIVRGDVFHPAFRWFFKWTNQIPIYRFRDGFSKLRDNYETFQNCYAKLNDNAKILIFSEGGTKWTKQLRPIQRGTAHIATGAMKAFPDMPLQILPVGINFEDVFKFRSTAEIKVGKAFSVRPYMKEENPIGSLTQEIHAGLSTCVVHLEDEADIPAFNLLCELKGVFHIESGPKLSDQFTIAQMFNQQEIAPTARHAIDQLLLIKKELNLVSLDPRHRSSPLYWAYYLWWPMDLILTMLFAFPAYLAIYTARKVYDHPAFEIPIRIGFSFIYYLAYLLIVIVGCSLWYPTSLLVIIPLLIVLPYIYIKGREALIRWKDQLIWNRDSKFSNKVEYIQIVEKLNV